MVASGSLSCREVREAAARVSQPTYSQGSTSGKKKHLHLPLGNLLLPLRRTASLRLFLGAIFATPGFPLEGICTLNGRLGTNPPTCAARRRGRHHLYSRCRSDRRILMWASLETAARRYRRPGLELFFGFHCLGPKQVSVPGHTFDSDSMKCFTMCRRELYTSLRRRATSSINHFPPSFLCFLFLHTQLHLYHYQPILRSSRLPRYQHEFPLSLPTSTR